MTRIRAALARACRLAADLTYGTRLAVGAWRDHWNPNRPTRA
ncbi:hypothetical protein ACFQE5_04815 [Pseudonocardia hispaniensis]|uniref:Uncharacterized protein n=1 Tax=Pseudonocardia hispaniensis TaxID=904933 RepID=A0ABW1IYX9_9PSEU